LRTASSSRPLADPATSGTAAQPRGSHAPEPQCWYSHREQSVDVRNAIVAQEASGHPDRTSPPPRLAASVSAGLIYKSFGGKGGLVRAIQQRGLLGDGPVGAPARSDALSATDLGARSLLREWSVLSTEVAPPDRADHAAGPSCRGE
jgi:hypothetical protein